MSPGDGTPDVDEVAAWLARDVDPSVADVTVRPLGVGHSNGAWSVEARGAGGRLDLVLKVPRVPSVVHDLDPCREADLLAELGRRGAPVPRVRAISRDDAVAGGPCFVTDRVEGTSVADDFPAAYHGPGWFRECSPDRRRAVWESFHDRLAELHCVPTDGLDRARHGGGGTGAVIEHWRAGLLAAVHPDRAPTQLAALDWLAGHVPPDADGSPALCLGDARLVNGIVAGDEVRALVDFEIAYLGNPAADVAYSLYMDERHRHGAETPLDGLPTADETWRRWSEATGRRTADRAYWAAFGAMVICVTASRAMVQWGLTDGASFRESDNALVAAWDAAIGKAAA